MHYISANIKKFMELNSLTLTRFAKSVGISKGTVSRWFNEEIKPSTEILEKISKTYKVPVDFFMDESFTEYWKYRNGKWEWKDDYENEPTFLQPVYDVAAGQGRVNGEYAAEHISSGASDEYSFIRIHGDSMLPYLQDGDLVKVHNVPDITPSDFTVIKVDGETATIKYVEFADGGVYLRASNKDVFEDTFYDAREIATLPIKVIGKAVAIVERML